MLNLCVCIPIHLHTTLLDQWCDLDLDSDFIIPFAMEFPFRTRTLCVPHTQMQAYYEHLFSISFVFQLIVSNGMRTHKFYASIKWKNESLPTRVDCGTYVLQWSEWQYSMTSNWYHESMNEISRAHWHGKYYMEHLTVWNEQFCIQWTRNSDWVS